MPTATNDSSKASKPPQKLSLAHRSRSVPHKKPFIIAAAASLLFYFSLVALAAGLFAFFSAPPQFKKSAAHILVAIPPISSLLWIIAYFKRRQAFCPLCKSTPLLDNLASKHEKARKCKPLNYGTTAILSTIFRQRMRCMYCGTPFDFMKTKPGPIPVEQSDCRNDVE